MDEVFFVDLPNSENRIEIFKIHFSKRKIDHNAIDFSPLATASEGFSGSEIEQAVASALYSSHSSKEDISTQLMLDELSNTQPLSSLMAEQVSKLRHWANGRTVPVD